MPEIKIILPCIMLLVMMLFGLGFTVLGDAYIQRVHRRVLLIIAALDIVHLLKDFAGWYFNDAMQIFPSQGETSPRVGAGCCQYRDQYDGALLKSLLLD